jgi:hypothetical protein
MAEAQTSSSNTNSNHDGISLDVRNTTKSAELASILKSSNKYAHTTTTSIASSTTTSVAPSTNPTTLSAHAATSIPSCMANYTAIADTAATGNYITTTCPVTNITPSTTQSIDVILPDGSSISSSHTAVLRLPEALPLGARTAHIFPSLKSGSLISIGQLCDHGCTATFEATRVRIYHHDKVIMVGHRSPTTNNLWLLELEGTTPKNTSPSNRPPVPLVLEPSMGTANSLMKYDTIAECIAFYHASLFSPVISTWCDAIDAGHFTTWP